MSQVTLELAPVLASYAGRDAVSHPQADTLLDLLTQLGQEIPAITGLEQADAPVHKRIRVFLNDVDIHQLNQETLRLVEGDRVAIIPLTLLIPPNDGSLH